MSRHKVALVGLLLGVVVLQATQGITGSGDFTFQQSSSATGESLNSVIQLDGERSTELILPKGYSASVATPLLINLHGYTGTGPSQSAYTFLQQSAFNSGVAYMAPTGSEDNLGNTYWNATEACCDFNKSKVDDVAYIDSLIERAVKAANIDPSRIYLFGHSNGHFMAYAYLCSGTNKIAAVAGLAGAMDPNPALCKARPNNILHIHGVKDGTILYEGGALFGNRYTSAVETVKRWSITNNCDKTKKSSLDATTAIQGEEVQVESYACKNGSLDFWTIKNGIHTPTLDISFADKVIDWLMKQQKV